MLTSPLRYQANESFVAEAVGKGMRLEISKPVSSNPENQFKFEVDTTGTRVQVYERGALKSVFFVGKAGSSFTETYIRAAGSTEVYLTNGVLTSTFNRRLEDWRDKTVFKTEQEGIKSVKFTYGDTTFTLALKDSSWRIGNDSTVESTVKSFLSTLANVQTDEFVDSALAEVPKLTAAIEVNGIQLRFYATKDATKYFVQSSDSPQWYVLQQWRVTQLLKRKKEFLPAAKA